MFMYKLEPNSNTAPASDVLLHGMGGALPAPACLG